MNACSTAVLDISAHYITPHNRTQQFVTMTTAAESQGDALKGTKGRWERNNIIILWKHALLTHSYIIQLLMSREAFR